MASVMTNGEILEAFSAIRIKHPRLRGAHQVFNDLRHAARTTRGWPQRFSAIFAPSQSGKSMCVTTYIETVVVDEAIARGLFAPDMDRREIARLQKLVVHVTLSAKSSIRGLAVDILAAFGDPASPRGTAQTLMRRVYDFIRHFGTELLVIDEIQHVDDRLVEAENQVWIARPGIARSTAVADTLKVFLLQGLVSLMFVGVPEARHAIFNDMQLASRCYRDIPFDNLDWLKPNEKEMFEHYIGRLGLKLRQHGLFEDETNLVGGDIPVLLHAASLGRMGMATNIVLAASMIAREDPDARCVTREHLAIAVDDWAIPLRIIDYNPFRLGLRTLEVEEAA